MSPELAAPTREAGQGGCASAQARSWRWCRAPHWSCAGAVVELELRKPMQGFPVSTDLTFNDAAQSLRRFMLLS